MGQNLEPRKAVTPADSKLRNLILMFEFQRREIPNPKLRAIRMKPLAPDGWRFDWAKCNHGTPSDCPQNEWATIAKRSWKLFTGIFSQRHLQTPWAAGSNGNAHAKALRPAFGLVRHRHRAAAVRAPSPEGSQPWPGRCLRVFLRVAGCYAYTYTHLQFSCACICVYIYTHNCTHIHVYICIYVYVHIYICTYICTHAYKFGIYIYIYTHICIDIHA